MPFLQKKAWTHVRETVVGEKGRKGGGEYLNPISDRLAKALRPGWIQSK